MARKTALDKFSAAINQMLSDYEEDVQANLGTIVSQMGKKGAKALQNQSKQELGGTGEYAKGWKCQTDQTRRGTTVTIYNDHPALAHLLEHGHVTRNGTNRVYTQTPAHVHIEPVEENLVRTFEREVRAKL